MLLAATLASLQAQDFPVVDFEILVVDDHSTPPVTVPEGVRLVRHNRPQGSNAARNTGVREASSDLLCFVDDDIEAPARWLSEVMAGVSRHPEADCFGGPARARLEASPRWICPLCLGGFTGQGNYWRGDIERPVDYVVGANFCFRRELFERVGEFDEGVPIYYDETEWLDRVKSDGAIVYLPAAWLWHRREAESARLLARMERLFRFGRGEAVYRDEGFSLSPLRAIPKHLAHAVHHRCSHGLVAIAGDIGRFSGGFHRSENKKGQHAPRRVSEP